MVTGADLRGGQGISRDLTNGGDGRTRRPRPASRARRLAGDVPETELSARLVAVCHAGERAVTVLAGRDRPLRAALGSPGEPEAFVVWRAEGVYVFLAGEVPESLELDLDRQARVTGTVRYGRD